MFPAAAVNSHRVDKVGYVLKFVVCIHKIVGESTKRFTEQQKALVLHGMLILERQNPAVKNGSTSNFISISTLQMTVFEFLTA